MSMRKAAMSLFKRPETQTALPGHVWNDKVEAAVAFINLVGIKGAAELIVYQHEDINELRRKNELLLAAYRRDKS